MALVDLQPAANISDNTLDNIPDVSDDLDDLFRPLQASIDQTTQNGRTSPKRSRVDELGIDEEIQVAKRRKPIAKLDDDRLLSQNGIPKLRRIVQEKLKFKGKGHEFSDISRMLNLYQLWLDDLYPRAKFADGLVMIEKLGHSKRMSVMRKEWIKESKVPSTENDTVPAVESENGEKNSGNKSGGDNESRPTQDGEESLFVGGGDLDDGDLPDEDELDALLADSSVVPPAATNSAQEQTEQSDKTNKTEEPKHAFEDKYAEEMRMMADMENW